MGHRLSLLAAVGGTLLLLECGRSELDHGAGAGPQPTRVPDPTNHSTAADAGVEGPAACAPPAPAEVSVPDTPPAPCGGVIAIAGTTPLGPFVASEVIATVNPAGCGTERLGNENGTLDLSFRSSTGMRFSVSIPPSGDEPWVQTFSLEVRLDSNDPPYRADIPGTLQITAADDPLPPDDGQPNYMIPPRGEVRGRIDLGSGCEHVMGSFVAPYCQWVIDLCPPP